MSYRIAVKCTKSKQGFCLKCQFCTELQNKNVICNAPNRCFYSEFSPIEFYCKEFRGFDEIPEMEQKEMALAVEKSFKKKEWVKHVNSYYPKTKAKEILKETKDKYK